jgi:hypothetical protein
MTPTVAVASPIQITTRSEPAATRADATTTAPMVEVSIVGMVTISVETASPPLEEVTTDGELGEESP